MRVAGEILTVYLYDLEKSNKREYVSFPQSSIGADCLWIFPADGDQVIIPLHRIVRVECQRVFEPEEGEEDATIND